VSQNNELVEVQMELLMARGMTAAAASRVIEASFSPSSVHVDAPLSNFAVSINNREMIADMAMPVVPVNKPSDKFFVYNAETMFEEQAASLTGDEAMPGRVRYAVSTETFSCEDYGLMDFVSYKEMEAADAPLAPQMHAVKVVTQRLDIAKERRVAGVVFASGSYGSNTSALSGAARWDVATSDPVQAIDDAIEACTVRPNVMVIGAQAWTKLKNHPKLKELILSRSATISGATPNRVDPALVASIFELDAIYVGRAQYNTNREGQTAARSYVWGKSCALIRTNDDPNPRETSTFARQFRFSTREVQTIDAPMPGLKGGIYVKVTESVDEKVVGGAASGFLYTTVVS
jgi:hypothetical protein